MTAPADAPTVLIAPDKFKGSLSATEVAERVAAGLAAAIPGVRTVCVPAADGGEGTLDAALAAGFEAVPVTVTGPTGRPIEAAFAVRDGVALVELALASGLAVLPDGRHDPLGAGSAGTGELIRAALDRGCHRVVVGIGGSACTDGGAGALTALGARLLDREGAVLPPGGGALADLARIDLSGLDPRLVQVELVLAGDVDNPLLGPDGAAAVYGPQKGAAPQDVRRLEAGLVRLVEVLAGAYGAGSVRAAEVGRAARLPGSGAAGGVGFALLGPLGATRRPGVELVLELIGFDAQLADADLVVTGEGSLDEQTLHGKTAAGVAAAARAAGVPVVAVAGRSTLGPLDLAGTGIRAVHALIDLEPDPQRCMEQAGPLLTELVRRVGAGWLRRPTLVPLFVNGGGMRGGDVHWTISDQRYLGEVRSASRYRFYSVQDRFPGMELARPGQQPVAVPGELYEVDLAVLRERFIPAEPAELELGVIELEDGSSAVAVVVRQGIDRSALTDISTAGGWRAHRGASADRPAT